MEGAIEKAHSVAKSHSVALSLNGDHIKINRFGNLQLDTVPRQLKHYCNNFAHGVFC